MVSDTSVSGSIIKRQGQRVRVDFSGGKSWKTLSELVLPVPEGAAVTNDNSDTDALTKTSVSAVGEHERHTGVVAEPLKPSDVKKGLAVFMIGSGDAGVVLRRGGKNAQVDFSSSGGEAARWVPCSSLASASAPPEADPEPEPESEPEPEPIPLPHKASAEEEEEEEEDVDDVFAELETLGAGESPPSDSPPEEKLATDDPFAMLEEMLG